MANKNTQTKVSPDLKPQKFRGLKLIANEFNSTIFQSLLFGTIMAMFSMIGLLAHSDYSGTEQAIQSDTFGTVAQSLSQAIMFSMINRIRLVVRDKSTLDRNRAMFLTNKKEVVVFSKVIVDLFSFMVPIIMVMIIGLPAISAKGGNFGNEFGAKMVAFIFAIMVAYLFSTFGMRYITSLEIPKLKMWIILGTWTTFTLIWMIGAGIAFGILGGNELGNARSSLKTSNPTMAEMIATGKAPISDFLSSNQIWLSCIPIINFLVPFMALYGFMDLWTVTPLIIECLIALIIAWRPVSKVLKTYLTT